MLPQTDAVVGAVVLVVVRMRVWRCCCGGLCSGGAGVCVCVSHSGCGPVQCQSGGAGGRAAADLSYKHDLQAKLVQIADESGETPPRPEVRSSSGGRHRPGVVRATPQCPLPSLLGPQRPDHIQSVAVHSWELYRAPVLTSAEMLRGAIKTSPPELPHRLYSL